MKSPRAVVVLGIAASLLAGAFVGSGVYTFFSAHGLSYMSDEPEVCVNCHIMRQEYNDWRHASHHANAVCNDCHLPHDSLAGKYTVKALNGWHHGRAFTMQDFAEPIRIKPGNAKVLEANCLRCTFRCYQSDRCKPASTGMRLVRTGQNP